MIAIVLFHETFANSYLLAPFHIWGHYGVDIFFFLSGMGIAVSLRRNSTTTFYMRRAKRLLPAWGAIICISYMVTEWNEPWSFIGLLRWCIYPWFALSWFLITLVIYYALSPAFVRLIERFKVKGIILLTITVLLPYFYLRLCAPEPCRLELSPLWSIAVDWTLRRLPVYLLGLHFIINPPDSQQTKTWTLWLFALCLPLAMLARLVTQHSTLIPNIELRAFIEIAQYYVLAFAIPGTCCLLSRVGQRVKSLKLHAAICVFGVLSLELYLWHPWLFRNIPTHWCSNGWIQLFLACSISLILAWLTHAGCRCASTLIERLKSRILHI